MRTRSRGQILNSSLTEKSNHYASPLSHIFWLGEGGTCTSLRSVKHIEKYLHDESVGRGRHCPSLQHTEDFLCNHPFPWCFSLTKNGRGLLVFQLSPKAAGSGWQCQLLGIMLGQKCLGRQTVPHTGAHVRSAQMTSVEFPGTSIPLKATTRCLACTLSQGIDVHQGPVLLLWSSRIVLMLGPPNNCTNQGC